MVHLNHFLSLFMLTGLLFGQDGLILKSGEVYNGTFIRNVDELIVFQVEGENHFTPFPINDVAIIKTSDGEFTYPFKFPTKLEFTPENKIVLKAAACAISLILFMQGVEKYKPGM